MDVRWLEYKYLQKHSGERKMLSELTGNRGTHSNDSKCSSGEHGDLGGCLLRERYLRMDLKFIHISSSEYPPKSLFPNFLPTHFYHFNWFLAEVCAWVHCGYGICTCLCVAICVCVDRRGCQISCSITIVIYCYYYYYYPLLFSWDVMFHWT